MHRTEAVKKLRTFANALKARARHPFTCSDRLLEPGRQQERSRSLSHDDPRSRFNAFDLVARKAAAPARPGCQRRPDDAERLASLNSSNLRLEVIRRFELMLMYALAPHSRHAGRFGASRRRSAENPSLLPAVLVGARPAEMGDRDHLRRACHCIGELKLRYKDVRWRDIAGIGNVLRHEYQRIDENQIRLERAER